MIILVAHVAQILGIAEQRAASTAPFARLVLFADVALPNAKPLSVVERSPEPEQILFYRDNACKAVSRNESVLNAESTAERGGMRPCKNYGLFP